MGNLFPKKKHAVMRAFHKNKTNIIYCQEVNRYFRKLCIRNYLHTNRDKRFHPIRPILQNEYRHLVFQPAQRDIQTIPADQLPTAGW